MVSMRFRGLLRQILGAEELEEEVVVRRGRGRPARLRLGAYEPHELAAVVAALRLRTELLDGAAVGGLEQRRRRRSAASGRRVRREKWVGERLRATRSAGRVDVEQSREEIDGEVAVGSEGGEAAGQPRRPR